MQRIAAIEGRPLGDIDPVTAQAIRERLTALKDELGPRIPFLASGEARLVIQNLVGSVQVTPELVLDISPKTEPQTNWAAAVIDLIVDERTHYGGETESAESTARVVLPDVFARLYADQLDRAVRREGPLAVLERRDRTKPPLTGRLDVTKWLTTRTANPAVFPQSQTELTTDNPYTSAMSWVAEALAARTTDPRIAVRLRSLPSRVRPGHPAHAFVDPGVALRAIPPQWRAYAPAWTTASSFIRRIAPLHRSGTIDGFGLAVEPWPLLETLLHRGLRAAAVEAAREGIALRPMEHGDFSLLTPQGPPRTDGLSRLQRPYGVDPDGSLWLGDHIVATFEAKYSEPTPGAFRDHYFQTLTTAAALGSPLAVLVYPEEARPLSWKITGFHGRPERIVAVGLDMYDYRRGSGDLAAGSRLFDIVRAAAYTVAAKRPRV